MRIAWIVFRKLIVSVGCIVVVGKDFFAREVMSWVFDVGVDASVRLLGGLVVGAVFDVMERR